MNPVKTKPILDLERAKLAATAALDYARSKGWKLAIAVVDEGGKPLYFERAEDVSYGSGAVALAKAESVAAYRRATLVFDKRLKSGRMAVLGQPHAFPIEGGVPLVLGGCFVGGIAASGALANEDTEACEAGARAVAETGGTTHA
jgi:glc operon protein GlcG